MNHLDEVRATIIKANPRSKDIIDVFEGEVRREYVVRLADVLLAIDEHNGTLGGGYMRQGDGITAKDSWDIEVGSYSVAKLLRIWNLRTDDLSQQSTQCIEFIHSLLCV